MMTDDAWQDFHDDDEQDEDQNPDYEHAHYHDDNIDIEDAKANDDVHDGGNVMQFRPFIT